jgi:ABC-type glycerol-3-phosphate transport system permease component
VANISPRAANFRIAVRLVIAVILIIFSIFPILWMISASLNPTGTLATQKLSLITLAWETTAR